MRWLVDECVHRILVDRLREAAHDVTFVTDVFPSTQDDGVFALAAAERRVLLTHDLDFGFLAFRRAVAHATSVILFRLHVSHIEHQWRRLSAAIAEGEDALHGHFTIVEDARIRARPLR